jgi:hypothetical protein
MMRTLALARMIMTQVVEVAVASSSRELTRSRWLRIDVLRLQLLRLRAHHIQVITRVSVAATPPTGQLRGQTCAGG